MAYFTLGLVTDILIVLFYRVSYDRRSVIAGALSFLITMINFFVMERVIVEKSWGLGIAYALGAAAGAFLGSRRKHESR